MSAKANKLTKKDFTDIGFTEHCTLVTKCLIFKLGRHRHLSMSGPGTPNEMLWICQIDEHDSTNITDLVCLHNFDYDGYITVEKIITLINFLNDKKRGGYTIT